MSMHNFSSTKNVLRAFAVLVSTDVAAMGVDVSDLNLSINIGKLKCDSLMSRILSSQNMARSEEILNSCKKGTDSTLLL